MKGIGRVNIGSAASCTQWWLRTAGTIWSDDNDVMGTDGVISLSGPVETTAYGVVPALRIKF